MNPGNQLNGLNIVKLTMIETGTYNPMFRRPYETASPTRAIQVLQESTANMSGPVSAAGIAGIANEFLRPSAAPEAQIDIVNGWNEKRMRFVMEVQYRFATGTEITVMILGYTDHIGINVGTHSVSPELRFYVNSVLHMRTTRHITPMGAQSYQTVVDNSHILANPNYDSPRMTGNQETRLRPEDVFSLQTRAGLVDTGGFTMDIRSTNTRQAVKSRRSNNLATSYMADILTSFSNAKKTQSGDDGAAEALLLAGAREMAGEARISEDPFLNAIGNLRRMPPTNDFTWRELVSLDPTIENSSRMIVQFLGEAHRFDAHSVGSTAYWGAADKETQLATILMQSISALMMGVAITRIIFRVTNTGPMGEVLYATMDAKGFTTGDYSMLLDKFQVRLIHEVLNDISLNNAIPYTVEANMDLLGESMITLSYDGPPVTYVSPSFGDALLVPVITSNPQLADNLASDFAHINDQIGSVGATPWTSGGFTPDTFSGRM